MTSRLAGYETSVFTEMTRLAVEHGAVNLGQGFPDFDGPAFVREAAESALRAGHNQYCRPFGLPALVHAIARHRERFYGLRYDAMDEVTVTAGATEAIFASIAALFEPGDEAIVFEPCYDSYRPALSLAGARAVAVPLDPGTFSFDPARLAAAVTPRTRAVIVNTPHNPLGKIFDRDELGAIASVCRENDLFAIADEVYEHLVFARAHLPLAALPGMRERTVMISSAGKTFGFTGWKIGYACAPPPLTAALRAAHQFITFTNGTPFQHAVAAGLAAPDGYFDSFVEEYRRKRDRLCAGLRGAGFSVREPEGTYFAVVDAGEAGASDADRFCRDLPRRCGVAAIPVSAFCRGAVPWRTYVRFAFCKTDGTLDEGIRRLRSLPEAPRVPSLPSD